MVLGFTLEVPHFGIKYCFLSSINQRIATANRLKAEFKGQYLRLYSAKVYGYLERVAVELLPLSAETWGR